VIFAEHRLLGSVEFPALVPYGYAQGIYRQIAVDKIENEQLNDSIDVTQLVSRLTEAAKG